ncbi:MAG: hypothetical protein KUF75_11405 [Candidatus Thiodiazotropha sp. (ex Ctena orbiculata)]|nr:hypothetical protein [Candidatus Thiodiazotropha taylori]
MTDFVATQAGDARDGGTYGNTSPGVEGTDYPDFTSGGDTLNDGGFAITNVSGILGDDTATPPLSVGGTVTLSGDLEIRPGDEAIAFNDGTLNQGAHSISVEPNDIAATLISLAGSGTSVWNASGEIHHDGTRNSNGTCEGLHMPESYNPSYSFHVNWPGVKYYGFGSGYGTEGLFWNGWAGDSFLWDGGKYTDCGQLRINLGPQGFTQQTTFRMDAVAMGAWRGTFSNGHVNNHPIRLQNFIASPTTMPRITNCLIFNDDPSDGWQLYPQYSGSGEIDLSGTTFLNYGVGCEYKDTNLDDTWFVITTETDDVSIGIGRDSTSTQSFNRVSITGASPNAHLVSISGDGSGMTYTIDDLIVDGCGYTYPGDRGDMPLIYSQTVTFNNILQVHSGGGINPSLSSSSTININRGTLHRAVNILCGEGGGAGSNATMIGDIKNLIISDPYTDGAFTDGGGFMTNQTAADVDYIAFIEAEMDANNLTHTTLGGNGYFDSDMTGHLAYGTNDIHVTDFQFVDNTRNGYVWASSLGYANSEQGLEDAILAGFGVTSDGADQTVDANANHANYRAYMIAGFTSSNTNLQGAGEGGADFGAFEIASGTTPVSNDLSLQWNALGRVTNDIQLRWELLNTIDNDLGLAWDTLVNITQDTQLAWDVLTEVTGTVDLRWDLLQQVTSDIGLQWQIVHIVQADVNIAWNMLTNVQSDLGLAWDILMGLSADLDVRWDMESALTAVSNDLGLSWDILSPVTNDIALRFQILQAVQNDVALAWQLLTSVQSDLGLAWNTLSTIAADLDVRWDVESALTAVSNDLGLSWNILSPVTNDIALRFQILQAVQSDMALAWQLLTSVQSDLGLAWNTLSTIAVDLDVRWDIRVPVAQDLQLQWDMESALTAVSNDLGLVWDVESALTPVSNDLALRYDIRQQIAQALDMRWDLLASVGMDLDMRWHVSTVVAAELALNWDTYQQVSNPLVLRWDSLEAVDNSLTFNWSIDGISIIPVSVIRVPAEQRVISVPAELRVIPVQPRR